MSAYTSISKYTPLEMRDGIVLHLHIVDKGHPVWMIITHGVCENLERYDKIVNRYQNQFNIVRYDLRGHGKSQGKVHSIAHFSDYGKDLSEIIHYLQQHYHMQRYVLFGHSMGGLIVAQYLKDIQCAYQNGQYHKFRAKYTEEVEDDLEIDDPTIVNFFTPTKGFLNSEANAHLPPKLELVFLSSPCVRPANVLISAIRLLPVLLGEFKSSQFARNMSIRGFIRESLLSHATKTDPIYHELHIENLSITIQLMLAIASSAKHVFSKPILVDCPIKAIIGTGDAIVSVPAFKSFFSEMQPGAEVRYIENAYHELMHESPEYKDQYFEFLDATLKQIY